MRSSESVVLLFMFLSVRCKESNAPRILPQMQLSCVYTEINLTRPKRQNMNTPPTWPPSLFGSHLEKHHAPSAAARAAQTDARLTKESLVSLRAITADNVRMVSLLDVHDGQRHLVAPNAFSLAQAYVHPDAWPRAIYADDVPVGFAMLEDASIVPGAEPRLHEGAPYVALWRFMIDARFQQLGFGAQALTLLIAHARTRVAAKNMLLSFVPEENNPEPFYQRFGFVRTGEVDDGEVVMRLSLA
jgi:diamine N-acetyltransferase